MHFPFLFCVLSCRYVIELMNLLILSSFFVPPHHGMFSFFLPSLQRSSTFFFRFLFAHSIRLLSCKSFSLFDSKSLEFFSYKNFSLNSTASQNIHEQTRQEHILLLSRSFKLRNLFLLTFKACSAAAKKKLRKSINHLQKNQLTAEQTEFKLSKSK